jgi:hypothetical protein
MARTYNEELTDAQVADIRRKLVAGWPVRKVAVAYGKPYQTILRIRNGDTYAHVQVAGGDGLAPAKVAGEMPVRGAIVEAESILAQEAKLDEAAMAAGLEILVRGQKKREEKENRQPLVVADEEQARKLRLFTGREDVMVGSDGQAQPANPYEGLSADEFRRQVENGEI